MPNTRLTTKERAALIRAASRASVQARNELMRESNEQMMELYTQTANEIIQHIEQSSDESGRLNLNNLQTVLSAVQARISTMSRQRDTTLMQKISQAVGVGTQPFKAEINADRLFGINHNAVAFVRGFTAADGLQLSDRLWRLNRGATSILADHIQHAVIHGESAFEAMQRSMGRGEGVPDDIARAVNAAKIGKLGPSVRALMTGAPDPKNGKGVVYQAMRVFNTELMRAHGEAYMAAGFETDGVVGVKYNLSPNHRKVDVCDRHASADNYNMGAGVYPTRDVCPWPAHPNTWSYVTVVFDYEVQAHQSKPSQEPTQPTASNKPSHPINTHNQTGSIGLGRHDFDTLQKNGKPLGDTLLSDGYDKFLENYYNQIKTHRSIDIPASNVSSKGKGGDLLREASRLFPSNWVELNNQYGPLKARLRSGARGFYNQNDAEIQGDRFATFVHEFTHRLQHIVPGLDDVFQDVWEARTRDEPLVRLNTFNPRYRVWEVTKKDHFTNPYVGKVYSGKGYPYLGKHGALEVMTMSIEDVLGGDVRRLKNIVENDRDMFDLVLGVLFHYDP